jgi:hypothetical protein
MAEVTIQLVSQQTESRELYLDWQAIKAPWRGLAYVSRYWPSASSGDIMET